MFTPLRPSERCPVFSHVILKTPDNKRNSCISGSSDKHVAMHANKSELDSKNTQFIRENKIAKPKTGK